MDAKAEAWTMPRVHNRVECTATEPSERKARRTGLGAPALHGSTRNMGSCAIRAPRNKDDCAIRTLMH